jgi:4-amino-4-deoxy-L-arabinose transferase-like glycosyltransferase
LAAFVWLAWWLNPARTFGTLQDDAIYFASARAIARGEGYLLPSFPGGLHRLKYPPVFPWLLSWVWRLRPEFPANLVLAHAVELALAVAFLLACDQAARRMFGLSGRSAALVWLLCACNLVTLYTSTHILSDPAFGALLLLAALLADNALERTPSVGWATVAGAVAGLSVGVRTIGVAVVAGLVMHLLLGRRWKAAAVAACTGAAASLPWLWPLVADLLHPPASRATGPVGWQQTLSFYTNYAWHWSTTLPNWTLRRLVFTTNALHLMLAPGLYLLTPLATGRALLAILWGAPLAALSWLGTWILLRQRGRKALHAIWIIYAAVLVLWPYPPLRMLLPMQVLWFAGLVQVLHTFWTEGLPAALSHTGPAKRGKTLLQALTLVMLAPVAVNLGWSVPASIHREVRMEAALLEKKRQAYAWIRAHTPPTAIILADNDVLLYLYTGRQSVRAIAEPATLFFRDDFQYFCRSLQHFADVAKFTRASYWMTAPDDFVGSSAWGAFHLRRAEQEILSHFHPAFQTPDGTVRIYAIPPQWNPPPPPCDASGSAEP